MPFYDSRSTVSMTRLMLAPMALRSLETLLLLAVLALPVLASAQGEPRTSQTQDMPQIQPAQEANETAEPLATDYDDLINVNEEDRAPLMLESTVPLCDGASISMTLDECVALVMRRNVNIRIAYLDRVLQKFDLVTTTDYTFAPKISLDGKLTRSKTDSIRHEHKDDTLEGTKSYTRNHDTGLRDAYSLEPKLSGLVPTGARYQMSWKIENSQEFLNNRTTLGSAGGWVPTRRRGLESLLSMSISQPLLKGAGIDYNMATVRQGVLDEKINVLNLKSRIISELTTAIRAYRNLLSAKWSVAISENSLQRAQENLELAEAKIKIGRIAPVDILQFQSDVANRELSLERARDTYNTARLDLLKLLDMNRSLCIEPVETLDFSPMELDQTELENTVFESRPEYLTSLLRLKKDELSLLTAKRDRLWNLSLDAGSTLSHPSSSSDGRGDNSKTATKTVTWNIGLNLNIPIFGSEVRSLRRNVLQAQSNLHNARINLKKQKEDILSELEQKISNIKLLRRQMEISHRARILADKKLEVERIKLQKGRSSTFQLVTFQDQQFQARETELRSRISYLNALAELDQFLGATMETWNLEFASYRKADEDVIRSVKRDEDFVHSVDWGLDLFP